MYLHQVKEDVKKEGDLPWLLLLHCSRRQLVTVTFYCLAPRSKGFSLSLQVKMS